MGSVGRYDSIDLTKFVLAFMVVLIHINPFSAEVNVVVMPVLRLAVPLFFIISAFFFFTKVSVGKGATESDVVQAVKRAISFTKRNLSLYFFWLAILIVPVISLRGWFGHGILRGVFVLLQHFFFGSTFIASWYIMALNIAVWVVLILSVKLSSTQVVAITAPFFVVSCLMSNYYYAPLTQTHLDTLEFAFWYPYNSFWIGLFWVAVGKWISDRGGSGKVSPLAAFWVARQLALSLWDLSSGSLCRTITASTRASIFRSHWWSSRCFPCF